VILLRTGVDLIEINRFEQLNPAIRQRFIDRVYTGEELFLASQKGEGARWATLAGRFAAKEAVSKALGCGIGPVAWKEIEIVQGPQGEPMLKLHGKAGHLAAELGLETWSISISHTQTHAVALAVGVGDQRT
jgi:holo-[acyl-carrier protein] synthase